MKDQSLCKMYSCGNKRVIGFPACSTEHGYEFKVMRQQVQKAQDGVKWTDLILGIRNVPIQEIQYYAHWPYKS